MRIFIIVVISTILLGLILNNLIDNPKFNNPLEEIEYAQKTDNVYLAEKIFLKELAGDKHNIDLNYGYVINHFNIPEKTKVGKHSYKYRDDNTIFDYYDNLISSNDSIDKDLGFYCKGLCFLCKNDYTQASANFKLVKNQDLKYLNNSIGNIFKNSNIDWAISYYEKEIRLKGNIRGAVQNLTDVLIRTKDLKRFEQLMSNNETKQHISLSKQREYYYISHDFKNYVNTLWLKFINSIDKYGFIGALLIAFIWLIYLRFIDVFEKEKWYNIAILFLISSIFTYCSYFLYDLYNITFNFDLNGDWFNDLLYCIFGIGFIEETIKIIPFILFLIFSRAVNEPIDYVIYACVAAIGFSFTENILYFQNDSYNIMHGRALASVVGHMCDSSIVAYGFIISRYKSKSPMFLTVLFCLLLASIVHGLYDFWLINDVVKDFNIFAIVVLISSVFIWNSIKNNSLNNSPFYDKSKRLESERISKYLFISLSLVFIFEYIIISINYGPSTGNRLLLKSILSGTFLMIFMTGRLAQFELKAGVWDNIKIWSSNKDK